MKLLARMVASTGGSCPRPKAQMTSEDDGHGAESGTQPIAHRPAVPRPHEDVQARAGQDGQGEHEDLEGSDPADLPEPGKIVEQRDERRDVDEAPHEDGHDGEGEDRRPTAADDRAHDREHDDDHPEISSRGDVAQAGGIESVAGGDAAHESTAGQRQSVERLEDQMQDLVRGIAGVTPRTPDRADSQLSRGQDERGGQAQSCDRADRDVQHRSPESLLHRETAGARPEHDDDEDHQGHDQDGERVRFAGVDGQRQDEGEQSDTPAAVSAPDDQDRAREQPTGP